MKKTIFKTLTLSLISTGLLVVSCNTDKSGTFNKIKKAVDEIMMVDTHEHLITEEGRLTYKTDIIYLMNGYFFSDLYSSGASMEEMNFIQDTAQLIEERWNKLAPYWEKAKNTGYGLSLRIAARDLFNIDDINNNTYMELNQKLLESNRKGWYNHVLKDKAGIELMILDPLKGYTDINNNYSDEYFVKVKRFDHFIGTNAENIRNIGTQTGLKINSLDDYIKALDISFQKAVFDEGIAGIKSGQAYWRTLFYEDVKKDLAEEIFNKMYLKNLSLNESESKLLQDFMMHQIIEHAGKYDVPVQIHTGILAGGGFNPNPIPNTNAVNLYNLFFKYKNTRFVIFHGSYPYMAELAVLAKSFQNVYIDMCWMYIISPSASKRYLEEWLFTVPANKIMAFGGDIGLTVEGVYGHAVLARKIVTEVLVKMVESGYYSEEEAIVIAKRILRENALELYNIQKIDNRFSAVRKPVNINN